MGNDTAAEIRGQTKKVDIAILLYKGFKDLIGVAMCYIFVVLGIVPCVEAIAGQETITNIVINFLGEIRADKLICYIIGLGGTGYGIAQNKSKKKAVARLADENKKLASMIDPQKQRSGLSSDGSLKKEI